jgi:hypothetical protein
MRYFLPALALVGCGLLLPARAADATGSLTITGTATTGSTTAPVTYDLDKAFSADQVLTLKGGMTVASKVYEDGGKIREELDMNGMTMIAIGRSDEKKLYTIMPDQKLIMEGPMPAEMLKNLAVVAAGNDTKYELIGPDIVDGIPCVKEKVTALGNSKVYFAWFNPVTRAPVKLEAADGSLSVKMKKYQAGPQDASLFEPPTGYQVMPLPENMQLPGMGQ